MKFIFYKKWVFLMTAFIVNLIRRELFERFQCSIECAYSEYLLNLHINSAGMTHFKNFLKYYIAGPFQHQWSLYFYEVNFSKYWRHYYFFLKFCKPFWNLLWKYILQETQWVFYLEWRIFHTENTVQLFQ